MIQFENVSKVFRTEKGKNQLSALKNINLTIKDHEVFGVIGQSGAGKSTLLRMINQLETPDEGRVLVDGVDVCQIKKSKLRFYRKNIGMIFQQFNLLSNLTVAENIMLPLTLHPYEDYLELDEVLRFVGLEDKRDSYPAQLSGGQKQRVGIARALIIKPKILLCDEPTSALDEFTTGEIVDVLRRINEKYQITTVIVTHELSVVKALCQRVAIMEEGQVVDLLDITPNTSKVVAQSYHERAMEVLLND
ncbi:methionine ABC transporter ATP-binding protein [Fundicoccus culcitae]|uniref:ATP-binding cassette domain-containing protein n=1 Tax=Fundicoccus culcitae TaxID=2969821 RepID=A0ABY5P8H2_9LACT|nr:ATP-binding cassette domain-containing protein [Fundicoccus culcitae]UUX34969.1 ATP-binding cassette domain-containing protein [Fundicoccus culcitae]